MPNSQEHSGFQANNAIAARVLRVVPVGLIIDLGAGREGLVRERELAWDAEARRGWRDRFQVGQVVRVVPLRKGEGRPEFSLRRAHSDPWLDVETRYPPGSLVEGVVTGVVDYGIFVELEAGVTGLAHASRFLPAGEKRQPAEVFWPGDYVYVTVDKVDADGQRIDLSMSDLLRRRWPDREPAGALRTAHRHAQIAGPAQDLLPLESLALFGARQFLVVDDEQRTREELSGWLRNAGHVVLAAHDGASALAAADGAAPEVALVDIDLPGQSGLEVMRRLRQMWPDMQGILMTGQVDAHEGDPELQALREEGVDLLWKPFPMDELLSRISGRQENGSSPDSRKRKEAAKAGQRARDLVKNLSAADAERAWMTRQLARLHNTLHADSVALFSLDPASRQVRLVEQAGLPSMQADLLPALLHSPVRDAAEDGATVRASNEREASGPRFRHLFALIKFDSCLGLPLSADLHERYALFAFFHQPDLGGEDEIVEARLAAAAAMLAARLERRQFLAQAAGMQRLLLLGQLSRSVIHEVNNQRQNVPGAVKLLQDQLQAIAEAGDTNPGRIGAEIERARMLLDQLGKELDRLSGVTDPLLLMARQDQREFLLLNQMIQAARDALLNLARRSKVDLTIQQMPPFCYTRLPEVSIMQVLVNILLNAIQQISRARGRGGGRVVISLGLSEIEHRTVYRICIEDDGPGIHRRLWERIFEMGYTEREDGSGLGLFISRNLVEAMGGRLYVAESAIGWGSTFVVELPQQS